MKNSFCIALQLCMVPALAVGAGAPRIVHANRILLARGVRVEVELMGGSAEEEAAQDTIGPVGSVGFGLAADASRPAALRKHEISGVNGLAA